MAHKWQCIFALREVFPPVNEIATARRLLTKVEAISWKQRKRIPLCISSISCVTGANGSLFRDGSVVSQYQLSLFLGRDSTLRRDRHGTEIANR